MRPKVLLSLAASCAAVEGSHLHEGLHEHLGQRLAEALDALKVVVEECLPRQRRNPCQPLLRSRMLARVQKGNITNASRGRNSRRTPPTAAAQSAPAAPAIGDGFFANLITINTLLSHKNGYRGCVAIRASRSCCRT